MTAHMVRSGLMFGLAGFGLLSIGDSVIKSIAGEWPGTAVAALRFCLGAMGLGVVLWMREGRKGFRLSDVSTQFARGAALAFATISFFLAIFAMPLAEATAIQFANPMLTAFVSAWLLKEHPPRQTWLITVVAFVGVLIVLRPNVAALGWAALLPLGSAIGMAFLMTFNRKAAGQLSPLAAQFWVAAFAAPLLVLAATLGHFSGGAALAVGTPTLSVIGRCGLVAVSASVAHGLIYMATTRASSAAIAPTVYIQIVAALIIGALWFGDWPDVWSLLGTAIIIGAGLWLWRVSGRRVPAQK